MYFPLSQKIYILNLLAIIIVNTMNFEVPEKLIL